LLQELITGCDSNLRRKKQNTALKFSTVDEYISSAEREIELFMAKVRRLILRILLEFKESMFFSIPTYQCQKEFVAFRYYQEMKFNLFLSRVLLAKSCSKKACGIAYWNNSLLFEKTTKKEIKVVKEILEKMKQLP